MPSVVEEAPSSFVFVENCPNRSLGLGSEEAEFGDIVYMPSAGQPMTAEPSSAACASSGSMWLQPGFCQVCFRVLVISVKWLLFPSLSCSLSLALSLSLSLLCLRSSHCLSANRKLHCAWMVRRHCTRYQALRKQLRWTFAFLCIGRIGSHPR